MPNPNDPASARRDHGSEILAVIVIAAVTAALELAAYLAARLAAAPPRYAVLLALAISILWIALVAPTVAAGARTTLGALLRAAAVADASAVTLLVLCLAARDAETARAYLPFLAAAKIYCTYTAVALAAAAAVRCARTPVARRAVGLAVAVILFVALASPFWIGGPAHAAGTADRAAPLVAEALAFNPFYSIASAVAESTPGDPFIWHGADLLYRISALDTFAPPPVDWYDAPGRYAIVALILAAVALGRHRLVRRPPDDLLP